MGRVSCHCTYLIIKIRKLCRKFTSVMAPQISTTIYLLSIMKIVKIKFLLTKYLKYKYFFLHFLNKANFYYFINLYFHLYCKIAPKQLKYFWDCWKKDLYLN